jgi:hypothetical protein
MEVVPGQGRRGRSVREPLPSQMGKGAFFGDKRKAR